MNKWDKLNENYLQFGLKIFPVIKNGKNPILNHWNTECSSEYLQVLYWMETAKDCNWGLPCKENNLFVLDLDRHDPDKNGVDNFQKLLCSLNLTEEEQDKLEWLEQVTPSGGRHIIFQSDKELKDVPSAPNAFKDYPGIDIRNSSYIVVEPSEINGKKYQFDTIPSAPPVMPSKLKKFILENAGTKTTNKKTPYRKPDEVFKGDRDNAMFAYINNLYFKTHLDFNEIYMLARDFNNNFFEEPLPDKDVAYKVKKAFEKSRGEFLIIRIPEDE